MVKIEVLNDSTMSKVQEYHENTTRNTKAIKVTKKKVRVLRSELQNPVTGRFRQNSQPKT